MGESLVFPRTATEGLVLSLSTDTVDVAVFERDFEIKPGDIVYGSGKQMEILAGDHLLGHVVSATGIPLDFEFDMTPEKYENEPRNIFVERKAPGVITRAPVNQPVLTGYKVIDCLFPIGRGQRELIMAINKLEKQQ